MGSQGGFNQWNRRAREEWAVRRIETGEQENSGQSESQIAKYENRIGI